MSISEDNVVKHIKKRNESALAFIVRTYGGLLAAIIKRHVQFNEQEYEECLDDVLLAVWHHIDSFDEERNTFKQWIAAIAKHRAIDYQRRMSRRRQHVVPADITDELYYKQPVSMSSHDVEDVLEQLSDTERAVFEKYYLEGVPSREMAQQLNVKESWIHNKLSRGRSKLRDILIPRKV
ncbi:sigma-70 family RNA polymerase sigma factor [Paenibacillus sp. 1011MAR3C5]|uniref:sigma-70 family RNA polymerase sigma factor n=1 Tax=Paenibacillus sp. 1011MAR3C5 TaxID=1675787 RepID=UPI000E6C2D0C|nr:sigma-70 family RNA polymerase sigma factor [Paenibacillus sp. 1011MAR3C5]RJE83948.1 sigma-70 family RNA polymerase sigma factor [Paenibacillus sp. 1011MAR3C5]